jgi:CheY-like chemotaxis protein
MSDRPRVLVVDDDPGICGFVAATLQADGHPVDTAVNGREALDRILHHRPALVLLDLQMPVMTG